MTLKEAKYFLRRILSHHRQSLDLKNYTQFSHKIGRLLLRSSVYKRAKNIALFLNFGREVSTSLILQDAWRKNKTVLIPDTRMGWNRAHFVVYEKGDLLRRTRYGPKELIEKKSPFPYSKIDLVLVPGLAFDRKGVRLGFGGGVYDRYLAKTPKSSHLGLFFSRQEIDRLPRQKFDHLLKAVVTEKGIAKIPY